MGFGRVLRIYSEGPQDEFRASAKQPSMVDLLGRESRSKHVLEQPCEF